MLKNKVSESSTLDFKSEFYDDSGEFVKDITAFANSRGGRLVIGVGEDSNGAASEAVGIPEDGLDQQIQRMSNWLREHVEPSIVSHVRFKDYKYEDKYFLVVSVDESPQAPHRVTHSKGKLNRNFYVRSQRDSIPASVEQLRDLFLSATRTSQRIKLFMSNERKYSSRYHAPVFPGRANPVLKPLLRIHIVPVNHFGSGEFVSWLHSHPTTKVSADGIPMTSLRPNADGMYAKDDSLQPSLTFQAHHNGVVEVSREFTLFDLPDWDGNVRKGIQGKHITGFLEKFPAVAIKLLMRVLGGGDYHVFATFEDVDEYLLFWGAHSSPVLSKLSPDNDVYTPALIFGAYVEDDVAREFTKPIADLIWRAWGEFECPLLD
tara:strand:- start:77 stop:1201 length:1125 start_codon:yes stop_codon:yes gene_type:complete